MQTKILAAAGFIALIILVVGGYTYNTSKSKNKNGVEEKIGVAVTIPPQAEFVEGVGGDRVRVTVMVPPGANPHTYEPKPSQLREASTARMYAKVGTRIEFELEWLDKILSINRKILLIDCSEGIQNFENDPHIWLSPRNAQIIVQNIYEGMAQVDPSNKDYYERNKEQYIQKLSELDKEITKALSQKKSREILVYHSEWAYFARDYNLEEIPIEKEGKEPSIKRVSGLIKQAKENKISTVFISPEFYTGSAKVIADEIGGEVVFVSTLQKNYIENMHQIAEAFAEN
ncbi:MAG TPA: zinc ABC transporter substrate-binding protein [Thermodesulfobacteriota bacterium]|nr:zinc ABC transporter substrate-binding protein [Thermodesulfobacteriota bacterium]